MKQFFPGVPFILSGSTALITTVVYYLGYRCIEETFLKLIKYSSTIKFCIIKLVEIILFMLIAAGLEVIRRIQETC